MPVSWSLPWSHADFCEAIIPPFCFCVFFYFFVRVFLHLLLWAHFLHLFSPFLYRLAYACVIIDSCASPSDNLISSSYSMLVFSMNLFGLFLLCRYKTKLISSACYFYKVALLTWIRETLRKVEVSVYHSVELFEVRFWRFGFGYFWAWEKGSTELWHCRKLAEPNFSGILCQKLLQKFGRTKLGRSLVI